MLHPTIWQNPLMILVLFSGIIFFSSCGITKNTNIEELNEVIIMKKGPCFGRCPVYTLTIYDNGVAAYKGEQYSDKPGLHTRILSSEEFDSVRTEFKFANLWQYKDVYQGRLPDLQTVSITYYEDEDVKTILGKDGRPEKVVKLQKILEWIASNRGWKLKEKPDTGGPDNIITDQIIVQLDNGVDANAWVRTYRKQQMRVLKRISPNSYYWLVTFNAQLIPPNELLELVRNDFQVVGAEFNKKLKTRS